MVAVVEYAITPKIEKEKEKKKGILHRFKGIYNNRTYFFFDNFFIYICTISVIKFLLQLFNEHHIALYVMHSCFLVSMFSYWIIR